MLRTCVFILVYSFAFSVFAQSVVSISVREKSDASSVTKAKSEIIKKAMQSAATQHIVSIIGKEAYAKKKSVVKSKILKRVNLFIPSFTTKNFKAVSGDSEMDVNMKLSIVSLRNMLLKAGLLYRTSGPPKVIPFTVVRDTLSGDTYSWWEEGQSVIMAQLSEEIEEPGFKAMADKGFYLLRPSTFKIKEQLGTVSQSDAFGQMKKWASDRQSQIFISGELVFLASYQRKGTMRIKLRLTAYQTSSGREMAEVVRSKNGVKGAGIDSNVKTQVKDLVRTAYGDLAGQIREFWKQGTFESKQLKLAITGDLSGRDIATVKKQIRSYVKEIKSMKERLLEPGRVTYDIDYNGDAMGLGKKLKGLNPSGFSSQVVTTNSEEIILDVKKL